MVLKDLNREDITISKNSRWFVGRLRGGYVLIFNWEDVIRTRVEFASTSFELGDKVEDTIWKERLTDIKWMYKNFEIKY